MPRILAQSNSNTVPMHTHTTTVKQELQKIKKSKQALVILIFLFITVSFWIGTTIFSSQTREKISPELIEIARPLNPNLRLEVLESIEAKRLYSSEELEAFAIYKLLATGDGQTQRIVPIETTIEQIAAETLTQSGAETSIGTALENGEVEEDVIVQPESTPSAQEN